MIDSTMNTSVLAAFLAAVAPLASFFAIMLFTRKSPGISSKISIGAMSASFLCALFLLIRHWGMDGHVEYTARWLVSGPIVIPVGVLLDPLSLLMLLVVATICLLVQVYSLEYMAGDPGFSRYYAFMSLFGWAMISMSVSPTMLQLYVFWELVGLSSYLLIGFWYEKFSASTAGKKAFVMTRLGDVAFFLGLLLVLANMGNLNILEMNGPSVKDNMHSATITISALLIFGGIVGKSAQFPLLTWLPDAMEGPTPVSALLHSATMVAAGVFLFARLFPFFSLSTMAMTIMLAIGTISMLLASTMAMVSRDIKQVWAYSTISQLGYMIMGLAAGGYVAGVFHLTTHAGFKALLFLSAGVFIHAYRTNDMFEIGKAGGRSMKIPMVCTIVAGAALAGLPPMSGFVSKELILGQLYHLDNPLWLVAGLAGVFLTAYYTFRLIFIVLFPRYDEVPVTSGKEREHHGTGKAMVVPLLVLAAVTVGLGFFERPFEKFLMAGLEHAAYEAEGHQAWLASVSLMLAGGAIILAWLEFGFKRSRQVGFVEKYPPLFRLFSNRWYIDHFYRRFLDVVVYGIFMRGCANADQKIIDAGLDALSEKTVETGKLSSLLHGGMIQYRLMVIFAAMAFLGIYYFLG